MFLDPLDHLQGMGHRSVQRACAEVLHVGGDEGFVVDEKVSWLALVRVVSAEVGFARADHLMRDQHERSLVVVLRGG